jgi:hypothetical protein
MILGVFSNRSCDLLCFLMLGVPPLVLEYGGQGSWRFATGADRIKILSRDAGEELQRGTEQEGVVPGKYLCQRLKPVEAGVFPATSLLSPSGRHTHLAFSITRLFR